MTKKKISIIAGVLIVVLIVIGGFIYKKKHSSLLPASNLTAEDVLRSPNTLIKTENDKLEAHAAWITFQKYISYAKAHNIKGLSNLSYKLSPTCSDPSKSAECIIVMDGLVKLAGVFDENMFTHVMYDHKQVILSGDYKMEENNAVRGYSHPVLYFIKDANGALKIVGFGPTQGRYLAKAPGQTPTALEAALVDRLRDSDMDGVADYVELCIDPSPGEICPKTDPLKRDTDGNGYWDGIDLFLNKK